MSQLRDTNQDILRARAAELARPLDGAGDAGRYLDVVEFMLAQECYAIEVQFVAEVYPFEDLAAVPGTPPFVVGIVNFRGRVLSILELKAFFQLPTTGLNDRNRAVVLRGADMEFGILVDAMRGTRRIAADALADALPTFSGIRERYVKGIAPDGAVVLDGGALLADRALVVSDE